MYYRVDLLDRDRLIQLVVGDAVDITEVNELILTNAHSIRLSPYWVYDRVSVFAKLIALVDIRNLDECYYYKSKLNRTHYIGKKNHPESDGGDPGHMVNDLSSMTNDYNELMDTDIVTIDKVIFIGPGEIPT